MNTKTLRIYKCGDGVYSAEILVPGFIDVWAPLRGPNGDTLFESKDEAIKAAKLEIGRRRIELALEERKRRQSLKGAGQRSRGQTVHKSPFYASNGP